jgi:hypothetical protein
MKQMKRKQKKTKRQTKKQQKRKPYKGKGGFSPSIAGGLANAIYLTPLAIRAGMKLLNRKTRRKSRF